jgi:DNA polymerase-3 subunit gamma/tau
MARVDSAAVSVEKQPQQQQQPSLYRRHRPRTFAEVVGQEPIVRTLRNAVERGKVHHAYLFVGSRGTGKTSMAKILAAALNCERGPTADPCGRCESCLSIARASSLDVIEMDAASNNSVDDIRELRESVAYAPVSGGRKVYILDEAHMLSTAAWNAFLKTLEEPPPNTVFVLATTEASKVPATVVDRCHRFDFQRPTVEQIATVLRRAAQAESIDVPPAAIAALARSATGSFRDALGTLQQIVTYGGQQIALEDVLAVLGVADAGLLAETVDAVLAGDSRRALLAVERCSEQGRDAASFASDLEIRCRELLVVLTLGGVPPELSLTPEADAALAEQAARLDHSTVVRLLELLGEAMEAMRAGADARTRLELALVKAARPEVDGSLRALISRIERLERSGPPVPAGEHPPQPTTPTPPRTAEEPVAEPAPPAPAAQFGAPSRPFQAEGEARPAEGAAAAPALLAPHDRPGGVVQPARGGGAASDVPAAGEGLAPPGDLESFRSVWPSVVELVRSENALLGALIAEAQPLRLDGQDLTLGFASTAQFLKKKAEDPVNRRTVAEALTAISSGRWQLSYELLDEMSPSSRPQDPVISEEQWISRLKDEFDAEEIHGEWGSEDAQDSGADDVRSVGALTSNEKGS